MDRAKLGNVEIEYEVKGDGEPVVLIHPGIFSDWFAPLRKEPILASQYRLVHFHRVGCKGSSRVEGSVSFVEQAAHINLLMGHLGIGQAHVVGHSSSGNVALQLALDSGERVHSIAVLEPALMSVPSVVTSRVFVGAAAERFREGDAAAAIDIFLKGTCGPQYRPLLEKALPHSFGQYVEDARIFFEQEFPALQQWSFTRDHAQRILQPVLAVVGSRSLEYDPIWSERQQLLLEWLPNVEPLTVNATHLLEVENPREVAEGLAKFFGRHPL